MTTLAGISDYLLNAELREPDYWHRQDYRTAGVLVGMVEQGERPNYDLVFLRLFGRHPNRVTNWWRNRRILLRLAVTCNTPTPLLVANRVEEVLAIIPDYDPTAKYIPASLKQAQQAVPMEAA